MALKNYNLVDDFNSNIPIPKLSKKELFNYEVSLTDRLNTLSL